LFVTVGERKSHIFSCDNMLVDDARVTNYCITGYSGTHDSLAHNNGTDHSGTDHSGTDHCGNNSYAPNKMTLVRLPTTALSTTVSRHTLAHHNCSNKTISAPTTSLHHCSCQWLIVFLKAHVSSWLWASFPHHTPVVDVFDKHLWHRRRHPACSSRFYPQRHDMADLGLHISCQKQQNRGQVVIHSPGQR